MSVLARTGFFASLVLLIGQLGLPGVVSTADGAATAVAEPVQIHQAPHPATCGARNYLPGGASDQFLGAPFAPAQSTSHKIYWVAVPAPEPGWLGIGADTLVLLPPSRAPPAFS